MAYRSFVWSNARKWWGVLLVYLNNLEQYLEQIAVDWRRAFVGSAGYIRSARGGVVTLQRYMESINLLVTYLVIYQQENIVII